MDGMPILQPPSATAFDAITSILSAAVYMIVALAALARAPRDRRVRAFVIVAAAGIAPYCMNALIWRHGAAALSKPLIFAVALSLMIGSLALLHFAQLFPWRRPWIRAHGAWLWFGYAVVLTATALVAALTPPFDLSAPDGGLGAVSASTAELLVFAIIGVALPVMLLLGIVVPLAGLLSLYKSFLAASAQRVDSARVTLLWMLISQLGGGVLTILIIPLLRIAAPSGPWVTIAAAVLFGCSLLMPIAFAIGIWRYGVLELSIEGLPQ